MRHLQLLRFRCGIEDFWPPGVSLLARCDTTSPMMPSMTTPGPQSPPNGAPLTEPYTTAACPSGSSPASPGNATNQTQEEMQCSDCHSAARLSLDSLSISREQARGASFQSGERATPAAEVQLRPLVLFGKHLCGAATDFALRCAQSTLPSGVGESATLAEFGPEPGHLGVCNIFH